MIEAFGLTSTPRKELPPAVEDVSFEAHAGRVTVLLGAPGAGRTTVLRLMLELQRGRGVTHFRGRPLHRVAHPSREVGMVLGEVPGHPARTVRGYLRMLCAAAGVSVRRADEVLESVGLVSLREERLGTLSRGMDRRLGLACALLGDPHTLVLDDPARGLSAGEGRWLHDALRAYAAQGGTVLCTTADPKEAARTADRVVTLERGRVVADQEAAEFSRTRLRPRVAVRTPHAARLAALLTKEARAAHRSVEVVTEGGNRLSVYGSTCADVGEAAFRNGVLVHQLADEVGDMGPVPDGGVTDVRLPPERIADEEPDRTPAPQTASATPLATTPLATTSLAITPLTPVPAAPGDTTAPLPPPLAVRSAPGPLWPLRYECRRVLGVGTWLVTAAVVLVVSAVAAVLLARVGHTPLPRLLAAWPREVPLPPAALGAGLLGALAFGEEFRHPALAADRGTVPRRLGLLGAKLLVSAATALLLAALTVVCDAELLYLFYGREFVRVPADWAVSVAGWSGLMIGCAWAGVLAAGLFRSATAGLAAVVAVPVLVVPLVRWAWNGGSGSVRTAADFPVRVREVLMTQWPFGGERYVAAVLRVVVQPVGSALALSLATLVCAYLLTTARGRARSRVR
ncbi:ABC transporter ATP-binding protein [Streptomyces sp. CRN 30]|uniref:ABC transporter ATP-binding protein n=1 Tax=Streptomyces sp. CRN 30 TaxID=3075613 RepID=UPI002A83A9B7|nr:ABC transporter ATP-binding protein [Streptomyces sp. CRN 30]